jgi:hypothetical protein
VKILAENGAKSMSGELFLEELIQSKKNGLKIYFSQDGDALKAMALKDSELVLYELDEKYVHRNSDPKSKEIKEYSFIRRK